MSFASLFRSSLMMMIGDPRCFFTCLLYAARPKTASLVASSYNSDGEGEGAEADEVQQQRRQPREDEGKVVYMVWLV